MIEDTQYLHIQNSFAPNRLLPCRTVAAANVRPSRKSCHGFGQGGGLIKISPPKHVFHFQVPMTVSCCFPLLFISSSIQFLITTQEQSMANDLIQNTCEHQNALKDDPITLLAQPDFGAAERISL
jgi:hypothetical protein